jgi:transposase
MIQLVDIAGVENIYYQDESGFDEYFTRRFGYALGGDKVHTQLSGKRYERQSCMAIRNYQHKLVEPMIYQGTADANTVYAYFETVLPYLKQGSIVVLDNASYHKSEQLLKLFHSHKISLIYLPAYSPDLNPIENLWGTIKQRLRNFYDHTISLFDNLCNVVNFYSV